MPLTLEEFALQWDSHVRRALGYATRDVTEDLVQHIWVRLLEKQVLLRCKGMGAAQFFSYLTFTVKNTYLNWRRTDGRRFNKEDYVDPSEMDVVDESNFDVEVQIAFNEAGEDFCRMVGEPDSYANTRAAGLLSNGYTTTEIMKSMKIGRHHFKKWRGHQDRRFQKGEL